MPNLIRKTGDGAFLCPFNRDFTKLYVVGLVRAEKEGLLYAS